MIENMGITNSLDGGFSVLWECEGATVKFLLVPKEKSA